MIYGFLLPFQLLCTLIYVFGSYFLTGNYIDNRRLFYFTIMCLLATISAQSWGFFVGSTMPIKVISLIRPTFCTKKWKIVFAFSVSDRRIYWSNFGSFVLSIRILYSLCGYYADVSMDVAHKLFPCWFSRCYWYCLRYESFRSLVSTGYADGLLSFQKTESVSTRS